MAPDSRGESIVALAINATNVRSFVLRRVPKLSVPTVEVKGPVKGPAKGGKI
jgi:hypothetical protein